VTPNAVASLIDYEIAGLGELLRIEGAKHTPYAWLSRSLAGLYKGTLVISLPGSPNAVIEGLDALHGLLPHLLKIIQGGGHA
jgi:molybdopterin biosynthesis enzyme MoaB